MQAAVARAAPRTWPRTLASYIGAAAGGTALGVGLVAWRSSGWRSGGGAPRQAGGPWLLPGGQRATPVHGIIGVNAAVYLAWKVAEHGNVSGLWRALNTHFLSSVPAVANGRAHTLLTSAYSHMGLFHLGFNMMALNSFGPALLQGYSGVRPKMRMSVMEFLAFYNVAALGGGLASYALCSAARLHTPALGASGAVFGVVTYVLLDRPDMGVNVMFLPMSGGTALAALTALNVAFSVAMLRRTGGFTIDGAAHLGGQAVGALWWGVHTLQGSGGGVQQRRPAPPVRQWPSGDEHRSRMAPPPRSGTAEGSGLPAVPTLGGSSAWPAGDAPPRPVGRLNATQTEAALSQLWGSGRQ